MSEPEYVSDAIVDLLAEAGIEHVAFNPGATFRGLHDSLVNHRDGAPEIVLCLHEEIAVSLAQGYAKAAGKPMAVLLHNVVGLQHAAMTVYNAWCDRVPVLLIGGTGPMSTAERRPWIDWIHTALIQGQQVRDYVKWDDQPADAASVPMSFVRAWNTVRAEPPGPVYLCLDAGMQEERFEGWEFTGLGAHPLPAAPGPDATVVAELAGWLRDAELPIIMTDYAGATPEGFEALVQLAEATHAPVLDGGARMSFPTGHELNFTGAPEILDEADAVIAVDVEDLVGALRGRRPERVADVTLRTMKQRSWSQDYGALPEADVVATAAAEPTLRAVLAEVAPDSPAARGQGQDTPAQPVPAGLLQARRAQLAGRTQAAHEEAWAAARAASADGAIPVERLAAELWPLIDGERWVLVHGRPDGPERALWRFTHQRQHLGWHGGGGLGHGPGASIGAALAIGREHLCISLQPDGDLLFTPSALWTAARYEVPILFVVQNNRQYQNTVEHAGRIAEARGRSAENRYEGAGLRDPDVDFVALARSYGVWAGGPVTAPDALAEPVSEALAVVKGGRPALVEVVTTGA